MAAQPGQGINNLATLIKRLEAATSRLEDIASSAGSTQENSIPPPQSSSPVIHTTPSQSSQLPVLAKDGTRTPTAAVPVTLGADSLPKSISAMDELIDTELKAFTEASCGVDSLVQEQATSVAKAFADQRRFLVTATRAKKPNLQSPEVFNNLLLDLQQDMGAVGDLRDNNRSSLVKEHLAMTGEGIGALQWLLMDGKPADYVGETIGGAQLYGNRVLKTYKDTDQGHVRYVRSYYTLLKALQAYILKFYPSGVIWNNNGIDATQAYREAGQSAAVSKRDDSVSAHIPGNAAPPPPPPPPPPPLPTFETSAYSAPKSAQSGADMGAVFEQLNRGEAVTAKLKRVDKSQMTHKNPSLRASSTVGETRSKSPGPNVKPKPASMRQNSSPIVKPNGKKELDGNKWLIENWDSPPQPITVDVSISHSILITGCKNTTVVLKGKANAISIDNSPRLQILVETLISSVDVIKSPNLALQVTGTVPTILLDQIDGASIYLGEESLATEILTSKCSSINIVLPPSSEQDNDSTECPIPEQIRSFIKDGFVKSEIVQHSG